MRSSCATVARRHVRPVRQAYCLRACCIVSSSSEGPYSGRRCAADSATLVVGAYNREPHLRVWYPPLALLAFAASIGMGVRRARRSTDLQIGQARVGVAEPVERDAHAVHDPEIQAAHLAVLVAGTEVV